VNLDDLVPVDCLLVQPDRGAAGNFLDQFNLEFIARHRDLFRSAVSDGRCDGLWISVTAPTVLTNGDPSFSLFVQTTIWHLDEANDESVTRLKRFAAVAGGIG